MADVTKMMHTAAQSLQNSMFKWICELFILKHFFMLYSHSIPLFFTSDLVSANQEEVWGKCYYSESQIQCIILQQLNGLASSPQFPHISMYRRRFTKKNYIWLEFWGTQSVSYIPWVEWLLFWQGKEWFAILIMVSLTHSVQKLDTGKVIEYLR